MICPECRTANPEAARFCMNCGAALAAGADPKRTVGFELDRYIPRELAAKLEAARAHGGMAGERRVVTILFCDIKGSTAAAEQLDPEEWAEVVNGAFEHMIRPVYKYEGMVPRLMGDAILAFFGAPIAHEDDPQRALLAALEIRTGIDAYAGQVSERHGVDFQARVGIHTGLVVVGEIGSDLRLEYTAIGDAINLAARMEQTAEPGTIRITEETYKLTRTAFEFEALGETPIKGKAAPVRTFRVLAAKAAPGRSRGVEGLSSPLVGRDAELRSLETRLESLSAGRGAVTVVTGEAGLGKTSLIAAARQRAGERMNLDWLEGQALSYARSVSYFAWRQVIRQSIGAREQDAPAEVRGKLRDAFARRSLPGDDVPFIETMLAVESEESLEAVSGVQGEALVARVTQAVRGYLCALARETPLVIVLDDLHWMDSASLELLSGLVDLVDQNAVLFISMSRPAHEATGEDSLTALRARLGEGWHEIGLQPLPAQQTAALAANLLGLEDLPTQLSGLILEKAEGNPFFVEEVLRSLIETGQLQPRDGRWQVVGEAARVSIPNTLAGVLGARIDRLPEDSRRVLQIAAVIGRAFEPRLLASAAAPLPGLETSLEQLLGSGLVVPLNGEERPRYMFRHALVQDAAYDTILLKERRRLHGRVGEILEDTQAARLEELAPVLAHHFHAADDPRSLKYDTLAGEAAARLYANAEAAVHFGRALETARRIAAAPRQIGELFARWGNALEQCGRYEPALAAYDGMLSFARQQADPGLELGALTAQAKMYSTFTSLHNPRLADEKLEQALELARRTGDRDTQTRLLWHLMLNCLFSKRLDRSLAHGERALSLARESGHRENLAYVLNDLCRLHTCRGEFEKSHRVIREARELWRALDNQVMVADSLGSEGEAYFNACEYDKAHEVLTQALSISERIHNVWGQCYDRMLIAFVHFQTGRLGMGIPMAEQSVSLGDEAGLIASNSLRAELAWVYAYCGAFERSLTLAEQALRYSREKQSAWIAFSQAAKARIHLLQGDVDAAAGVAGGARLEPISIPYARYTIFLSLANLELDVARGEFERALEYGRGLLEETASLTRVDIPELLRWNARALSGLGRFEEARGTLTEARRLAADTGTNLHLWPILADLARVNIELGEIKQADADRGAARRVIETIAESLRAVALRESFLRLERVREALE